MAALSKKLRSVEGGRLMFWCPGCDGAHQVGVGDGPGPRWGYNGNPDAPTFTPSILVEGSMRKGPIRCHSFVTEGRIQFLADCNHALAGQTVEIPDWEEA
ncbi:ammonia monooxygenase [Sinorhizobium meliloti]|uniref:DUF6527 family protein n=1 Tax=Rhizobium meliloti TaxID=382 RepID=UPI000FE0BB69|nr:DUF6527 family protein [Sinorhizobium meliloti]RVK96164.1 ammonia monooxygenase [Sinorhizobium meliloti]